MHESLFSENIIRAVFSTYLLGTTYFDNDSNADVLGQLLCYAARDWLRNEVDAQDLPLESILQDLVERTKDQVPQDVMDQFGRLTLKQLESFFKVTKETMKLQNVTHQEMIKGLTNVNVIISIVLNHTNRRNQNELEPLEKPTEKEEKQFAKAALYDRPKDWFCLFCGSSSQKSKSSYQCAKCKTIRPCVEHGITMIKCQQCLHFSPYFANFCEWCGSRFEKG
jgi:hypothetical protein